MSLIDLLAKLFEALFDVPHPTDNPPKATRDPERTLKWVARRVRGEFRAERAGRPPTITWNLGQASAILHYLRTPNGDPDGFALRIGTECSFRLRVRTEVAWDRVRQFFGSQDIATGDSAFDSAFLVQSDSPAKAREVLASEVRTAMIRLGRLGRMTLEAGPAGIVIWSRGSHLDDLERLCAFAKEALTLGKALLKRLEPAVIVAEIVAAGIGRCPVCGTPVESDLRECGRCRTPHHQDCWSYMGGCALFACAAGPEQAGSR